MNYIKSLSRVQKYLGKGIKKINGADGGLTVPIDAILDFLKEYELGTPEEFYDATYYGVQNWFKTEIENGNMAFSYSNNTYDCNGQVLYDFGFVQYDSLVDESVFVMIVFHFGNPAFKDMMDKRFEPIVFKFEEGTSFYDVLDQISLESSLIPCMNVKIDNLNCKLIPRITHDSYFVFCQETGEELYELEADINEIVRQMNCNQYEGNHPKRNVKERVIIK